MGQNGLLYKRKHKNTTTNHLIYFINMNSNNMLNQIKTLLGVEVELAQAKLENGTVIETEAEMTVGQEVFIVTDSDEKIKMPVGSYTLEDGKELIIKEEGIIDSIGEPKEEEIEASEEVQEENLEEDKQEMTYATKEELAEVKTMIEEIKAMIEAKDQEEEKEKMSEEVKEELSAVEPVEKVKHNPETEIKKKMNLYSQGAPKTTINRVFEQINKIKN